MRDLLFIAAMLAVLFAASFLPRGSLDQSDASTPLLLMASRGGR